MDEPQGSGRTDHGDAGSWLTRQEIVDALNLEKSQVKDWIKRHNRRQAHLLPGLPPKQRGHVRVSMPSTEAEYQREITRLRMENELLRDFLKHTERPTMKSQPLSEKYFSERG